MVLLASLLVVGAAFAGCVGQDDNPEPASDGNDPGTTPGDDGSPTELKVLAPLVSAVSFDGPEWVAPGAKLTVTAAAPANAKGDVTYTWAIGPLPKTVKVEEAALDTKTIEPGASAKLTFEKAGVYGIHCHPHPFMLSNVTVVEGYAGPTETTVYITDGAALGEYVFTPERVVIPAGGSVVYKNVGSQAHTATQAGQEPALKALDLKAASGEVTLSGDGWQRLVLLVQDSEGRVGIAEKRVYVKALPADYLETFTGKFNAGVPAPAPPEAQTEVGSFKLTLDHAGEITLNFSAVDAAADAGSLVNTALVEVHLKEDGASQDTLTSDPKDVGSLTGLVGATTYELTVIPRQGAAVSYEVVVSVVYDLTPPEPVDASAGGSGGGHSGHAH